MLLRSGAGAFEALGSDPFLAPQEECHRCLLAFELVEIGSGLLGLGKRRH